MGLDLTTDRYPPITNQTRYPLRHAASDLLVIYSNTAIHCESWDTDDLRDTFIRVCTVMGFLYCTKSEILRHHSMPGMCISLVCKCMAKKLELFKLTREYINLKRYKRVQKA